MIKQKALIKFISECEKAGFTNATIIQQLKDFLSDKAGYDRIGEVDLLMEGLPEKA